MENRDFTTALAAKLRNDGMTVEDFEKDPFDEKALRILANSVAPRMNHKYFLANRQAIRRAMELMEFRADKQVLTDRKAMTSFYDDFFGKGWAGPSFVWPKAVHVYGGAYYIEESKDGIYSFEGNHKTSYTGTLEECETALFNTYIKN